MSLTGTCAIVTGGDSGIGKAIVLALVSHSGAEIGSVVAFLAGPGAGDMTGTTVFADAAIMLQSPGM